MCEQMTQLAHRHINVNYTSMQMVHWQNIAATQTFNINALLQTNHGNDARDASNTFMQNADKQMGHWCKCTPSQIDVMTIDNDVHF
jgi:hypothetical protein